jgi:hypothetical protein
MVRLSFTQSGYDRAPERQQDGGRTDRQRGERDASMLHHLSLRPKCRVAIAGPAIVDAAALVNRDVQQQPLVSDDNYTTGKNIVASEYEEARGVPVFHWQALFDEIASLDGRQGARRIVDRHLEDVTTVPLADAAFDIDTPRTTSDSHRPSLSQ